MKITVRFFAMFRERLGTGTQDLELDYGATAGSAFDLSLQDVPELRRFADSVMLMVNEEYVEADHPLQDGDELAIIPPVSGGAQHQHFMLTDEPIDARAVEELVGSSGHGAIVTFLGTVRDNARGMTVTLLEYEAYASAAVKMLSHVGDEARSQWPDVAIAISHRTGALEPGEISVVIACASPHRENAYAASTFAISRIKEIVPIWKKEHYLDGTHWVGSEVEYQRQTGRIS